MTGVFVLSVLFLMPAQAQRATVRVEVRAETAVKVDVTDAYLMTNLPEPTTNMGAELLATLRRGAFSGTATYTYVRSRVRDGTEHLDVPLPPGPASGSSGSGNPRT